MVKDAMIEQFERTLTTGGDLEQARQTLLTQANTDRMNRISEIEHDFRIATLVRECLLTEPKGTGGYAVAKGIMNRLHEQYRNRAAEKLCRQLLKDERKEALGDDENNGAAKSASITGTEPTLVG
jgi:hypothetical protein